MATTTKGTQQKRRSKGDGSIFKNKRGGWTARYRKKGLPDKEFSQRISEETTGLMEGQDCDTGCYHQQYKSM